MRYALLFAALLSFNVAAEPVAFGLFGDTPYSNWERDNLPRLIDEMDNAGLAFTIHDGDIKNGSSECSDAVLTDIRNVFAQARTPLVFVPGDNEWTDCHRKNNGGYDPLERLAKLRQLFFSGDESLGQRRLRLTRQSPAYPENVRWEAGGALFVGLNLPGSDNNYHGSTRNQGPVAEFIARSAANRDWVAQAFALAREKKLAGVLIAIQANPEFEAVNAGRNNPGYQEFMEQLRSETLAYAGQVVLVHGDTHRFQINQPMLTPKTRETVKNFTRVETFGSPFFGWIKGTVDAATPQVFRFEARPWRTPQSLQ